MSVKTINLKEHIRDHIDFDRLSRHLPPSMRQHTQMGAFRWSTGPKLSNLRFLEPDFIIPDNNAEGLPQDVSTLVENESELELEMESEITVSETKESSFTFSTDVTATVGASITAGAEGFGASFEATASFELSAGIGTEHQTAESRTVDRTFNVKVTVPPRTRQELLAVYSSKKKNVPWAADVDLRDAWIDVEIQPENFLVITLFEHTNFKGQHKRQDTRHWRWETSGGWFYDNEFKWQGWRDKVSSVTLEGRGVAELYEHPKCQGRKMEVRVDGGINRLNQIGGWNDRFDSMRLRPAGKESSWHSVPLADVLPADKRLIAIGGRYLAQKTAARVKAGRTEAIV